MKKILFFCLFCIVLSCKKEKTNITPVTTCIDTKLEAFKKTASCSGFVNQYWLNGKIYYHFDSGSACDGSTEVVDEQCVQYCITCGKCTSTGAKKDCNATNVDFFNTAKLIKQIWKL